MRSSGRSEEDGGHDPMYVAPSGLERWTCDRVVLGSNPAASTLLRNFGKFARVFRRRHYLVSMRGEVKCPTQGVNV